MSLGIPPQPTAPWRPLIFKVHCIVTQRWMKIRVPFNWFWFGDAEYGTPEVESGTIAAANPTPPAIGPRLPAGTPLPNDGPTLSDTDLEPYVTPAHREKLKPPPTQGEELVSMRERLRQLEAQADQLMRGPDTNRGGR